MSSKLNHRLPVLRLVTSALALILAVSHPPAVNAASDAGIWKIDPSKSKVSTSSATLTINRVEGGYANAQGRFVVISGGGVYLLTGAASESQGLKPVDFTRMMQTGEAILIGTNPHSKDACGFACRAGLPERTRTVTFNVVKRGEQDIRDMLASGEQN